MTINAIRAATRSVRKNWPELKAFGTGQMPSFVYGKKKFRDVPVFCFHEAELPEFEAQLQFIAENGYRTLDGSELLERLSDPHYENDGKDIVLTFDDALTSVWTVAFPLLQSYRCKIMLFAIAELVPDDSELRPHVETGDETCDHDPTSASSPLCNWREIREMHDSGLVDVQSHGLYHCLVGIGPEVVDFVSPEFDPYYYGNIHVPVYERADGSLSRELQYGHPVHESDSRFGKQCRYLDSPEVRRRCAGFVEQQGGREFFDRESWRNELSDFYRQVLQEESSTESVYESEEQRARAIRKELRESRSIIEGRLPNKVVRHFCFPWFKASEDAYRLCDEEGYSAVHIGAVPDFPVRGTRGPHIVNRLEKEYLLTLPGNGRRRFTSILTSKIQSRRNSARSAESRTLERKG